MLFIATGRIVDKLHEAAVFSLKSGLRSRLATDGAAPVGNASEAFMRAEHARWKEIVSGAKLTLN